MLHLHPNSQMYISGFASTSAALMCLQPLTADDHHHFWRCRPKNKDGSIPNKAYYVFNNVKIEKGGVTYYHPADQPPPDDAPTQCVSSPLCCRTSTVKVKAQSPFVCAVKGAACWVSLGSVYLDMAGVRVELHLALCREQIHILGVHNE